MSGSVSGSVTPPSDPDVEPAADLSGRGGAAVPPCY